MKKISITVVAHALNTTSLRHSVAHSHLETIKFHKLDCQFKSVADPQNLSLRSALSAARFGLSGLCIGGSPEGHGQEFGQTVCKHIFHIQ